MTLTLREALKSLCCSNGWSYAVFWRHKSPNRRILTWEDGHNESTKPPGISNILTFTTPESHLENWESGGDLLHYGIRGQDGCSMQDQTDLLLSKMSQQMHSLGEGIVGRVAFSGKYQWIIVENLVREWSSLGPLNPCSSFEYPDGWQSQLAAGIKTIAFIAVAPYGVVQLGSKQTIMEDLELVSHVKNLFGSVYNISRPVSQDSVQELLSGRIHGTQLQPGNKSGTLLHGIPKQSMCKNSSLNVSEQGGDSSSILATSKGIQVESHVLPSACSSSSFAKCTSQFSHLQKKGMQLSGFTPLHNNNHETLLRETRILPSARVIYPSQDILQARSCEVGNRQSLFNCSHAGNNQVALMEKQLVKELGLQGHTPVLSGNGQSTVNTKFQNNTQSAQEASFLNSNFDVKSNNCNIISHSNVSESSGDKGMLKSVWLDLGPSLTSPLEQTEIPSSVPALHGILGQTEFSISSSVPVVNANQVEQMGRKVEHLAELDSSHLCYEDPMRSSATIQAPLAAVMDRYTSWGMTSGQHENTLQETVSNRVIPSSGDDFISAVFGIGSHSWDKDLTAKDVSSLFQDVMVDNLYPGNESSKDLEAPFGEVITITDECAYGFDDAKSLTKGQGNCTNSIVLPAVDELFDVLHPAFKKCKTQGQGIWDDISLPASDGSNANFISHSVGVSASSQCLSGVDILQSLDASMDRGFEGGFYSDRKSEHLLDAVVASICPPVNHSKKENTLSNITCSGLNGATSLLSPSVKTNSCLSGTLSSSDRSKYVGLSRCGDNMGLKTIQSSFTSEYQGETTAKSTSNNTSLKFQLSSWIEDNKNLKGENLGLSEAKKLDGPVKVKRKRAKSGESTRPRPKDRQQIQDRVKELREIVPNGTKCSIDALLERTIKHMLFLQSVTKHADKLKHSGEQKGFDKDVSLGKNNLEGGASWALEVGGQSMGCPIIVENMNQPRQMLVEMLCEERGLFLEIADIIRGLGLTILKGVMEARKDKIWARFAVEANRDVHRVEILWSLMQLLQQSTKNTTSASSQPSILTDEGINGSRVPNVFQQSQVPSTLSIS